MIGGLLDKINKFLDGKKTYITMACVIIFGALDAWNEYCGNNLCYVVHVPSIVFVGLGMLGIYTRSAVKK